MKPSPLLPGQRVVPLAGAYSNPEVQEVIARLHDVVVKRRFS